MAKVVIAWNEHPTEVIAGFHARKVAEILREQGHEVILHKFPVKETNYGIVAKNRPKKALRKLLLMTDSFERAQALAIKHGAFVFNFHASAPGCYGTPASKEVKDFEIAFKHIRDFTHSPEIPIFHPLPTADKHFVVEVPGDEIKILSNKTTARERKQIQQKLKKIEQKLQERNIRGKISKNTDSVYYNYAMPINPAQNPKYLDSLLTRRIAATIHEKISS